MKVEFLPVYLDFLLTAESAFKLDMKHKLSCIKQMEIELMKQGKGNNVQSKFNLQLLNNLQGRMFQPPPTTAPSGGGLFGGGSMQEKGMNFFDLLRQKTIKKDEKGEYY
jgi:hypothetical protein